MSFSSLYLCQLSSSFQMFCPFLCSYSSPASSACVEDFKILWMTSFSLPLLCLGALYPPVSRLPSSLGCVTLVPSVPFPFRSIRAHHECCFLVSNMEPRALFFQNEYNPSQYSLLLSFPWFEVWEGVLTFRGIVFFGKILLAVAISLWCYMRKDTRIEVSSEFFTLFRSLVNLQTNLWRLQGSPFTSFSSYAL